ncbi:MAG: hypothetical protein R3C24_02890 [Cyanobacteriota/Melainabacteria group bacterium]
MSSDVNDVNDVNEMDTPNPPVRFGIFPNELFATVNLHRSALRTSFSLLVPL